MKKKYNKIEIRIVELSAAPILTGSNQEKVGTNPTPETDGVGEAKRGTTTSFNWK